jgi:hypothetical protein
MTDVTLEDLASGSGGDAAKDAAKETAESGESLMELVEFMDERGYLQPLMFGMDNNDTTDPVEPDTNAPATSDGDGVPLTAANIERLAGVIQERVGDVPISKIQSFASSNPEKVNALIANLEE